MVRQSHVTSATGGHRDAQRIDGLLQRSGGIGDLDEPQVEMIGAQAYQGVVESIQQCAARGVRDRTASSGPPGAYPGLRDEDQIAPVDVFGQQPADHLLGGSLAVRGGGVEKSAACVEEDVQLLLRLELVGVPPPGHRAESH
jgi:hypothetical protein